MSDPKPKFFSATPITQVERNGVRNTLVQSISKIELGRGKKPDPAQIERSVAGWEGKIFEESNGSREEYIAKARKKQSEINEETVRISGAPVPQQQQQTRPTTAAPQQQQARPQVVTVKPVAVAQQQQQQRNSVPPSQQPLPARQPQQYPAQTIQVAALYKDFLDEVKDNLDECRTVLRINALVVHEKIDSELKAEMVLVHGRTTALLKAKLTHYPDLLDQTKANRLEVRVLKQKLELRFQKIADFLKFSCEELFEADGRAFGPIQQLPASGFTTLERHMFGFFCSTRLLL
jgi:hypothetical protein